MYKSSGEVRAVKLGLAAKLIIQNIKNLCRQSTDIKSQEDCVMGARERERERESMYQLLVVVHIHMHVQESGAL